MFVTVLVALSVSMSLSNNTTNHEDGGTSLKHQEPQLVVVNPPKQETTATSNDNRNMMEESSLSNGDTSRETENAHQQTGGGNRKKKKPPAELTFSKELPTGILSQKPSTFFAHIRRKIDQDNPYERCRRYGFRYHKQKVVDPNNNNNNNNDHTHTKFQPQRKRRLFYGSLIAEEPWELLEIVAAESFGIYTGMVLVEGNRTQNYDARPVRRANDPTQIRNLQNLFGTQDLQIRLYSNENPNFTGLRREHAQRQEILRGWKEMGMLPDDVGVLADMDETFSRDFLRAVQECEDVPAFDYTRHECFTSHVKIAASSRAFETSPECIQEKRSWMHPEMVMGHCMEEIGNVAVHGLAVRDGPRRAHGYGRACSHDFSKLADKKHPLWNAADFRMLCGHQIKPLNLPRNNNNNNNNNDSNGLVWSNYTGFHFHNFFTSFNATRIKMYTYGHAVKARKAFAVPLEDMGANDLKLMYRCLKQIPDDNNQKWKRSLGGLNASQHPIPIYFHDQDYVRARHEWVTNELRKDDAMVQVLQRHWNTTTNNNPTPH